MFDIKIFRYTNFISLSEIVAIDFFEDVTFFLKLIVKNCKKKFFYKGTSFFKFYECLNIYLSST